MKGLIAAACCLLLAGCSRADKQVAKGIDQRRMISDHVHRSINVQKSRAQSRKTKLDEVIEENR